MLGNLLGVIDKEFKPRFKSESNYDSFEVVKGVKLNLRREFEYNSARYHEFTHGNKNLIRLCMNLG